MTVGRRTFVGGMLFLQTLPVLSHKGTRTFHDYLKARAAAGHFSGVALISHNGRPLLREAYGMADKSRGLPNTPRTRFCIASMGKMFTAVAVTRLVERGRLRFTDPIGKHVPGFPPAIAENVTVAQLLTHTSGMDDVALRRTPTSRPPTTLAGMMALIVAAPLQFPPGTRFSYSNDGFIVLGAIIEHVTGDVYADHLREYVFEPAGMHDTEIRVYTPAQVPHMAHGYMLDPSGTLVDNSAVPQIGNPSGGAFSTAGDMVEFGRAVVEHRLVGPALTEVMLAGKVADQRPGGPPGEMYAYGFDDQVINGVRITGHNGGTPGYESQLDIYRDEGIRVAVLTNQDGVLVPAIQESERVLTS